MIWLWIAAALVSAGAAALMAQRARHAMAADSANPALAVYRRQMAELDDLADRGLLADGERRGVRAETGRRLLAAADRPEPALTPGRPGIVLAAAALTPLAAAAAYLFVGAPQLPDQPFASRLAVWREAVRNDPQSLTAPQMAAVLRVIAAERPTDPEPLHNLAMAEMASQQPTEAIQAVRQALALAPGRADLWELLGVAEVVKAGDLSADAVDAFRHEAALAPDAAIARYYLAQAKISAGDVAGGLADWKALEPTFPPDDPRRAMLDKQIAEVSATGRLAEEPAQPAETSQGVGSAQIQGMVDGLAARLAAHPDDPEGWVRLVRAYSVLGEADRRDAALADARKRYAGHADVLSALDAAAQAPAQAKAP
jgi:cytochrome c-type biogenesis protein CcmH